MRCTLRRSNVPARVEPELLMSSAARCRRRLPPTKPKSLPSRKRGAANSCCKPRRGTTIPSTATLWDRNFPNWTVLTEIEIQRIHVDKGYCGHNHAQKFRDWISVRSPRHYPDLPQDGSPRPVEPVIGHINAEHPMLGSDPRSGRRDPQSRPKCV